MSHNIRGHWLGSGDLPDGEKTLEKNYELEKIGHWKSRLDASGLVINEDEMADRKSPSNEVMENRPFRATVTNFIASNSEGIDRQV